MGVPGWSQGSGHTHLLVPHLEAAVVLGDRVSEVHTLPLGQELTQLWPLLQPQVVSNKVPIDAISSPLLLVQQDVGSCGDTGCRGRGCGLALPGPSVCTLCLPPAASYLPLASPRTSGLPHGAARPSGWCGQSHQTFALASLLEERAGRDGGVVGLSVSPGLQSPVSLEPTPPTCSCSGAPALTL